MSEVNFLPEKRKTHAPLSAWQKKLMVFSVIVLFFVGGLTALVFFFWQYEQNQLTKLAEENKILSSQISNSQDKINSLTSLHSRIQAIKYIISNQFDYAETLRKFYSSMPSRIAVESFKINHKGEFQANLVASGSGDINDLSQILSAKDSGYTQVEIGDISFQEKSGNYRVPVSFLVASASAKPKP